MMENWNKLDDQAITVSRALAMDAVQKVGNGHPGTAMSLAPVAYLLFQKYLRHNPRNPQWIGRDRFVLSAGHSSLTLYIQLFLAGYDLSLEDLKSFRTLGSLTPGHPEFGHTAGVEITTGPLGSGISSAVGMAMASRYELGLLDPEMKTNLFKHNIWVIASDGDLQEGISSEASSLAGTQALGNLKVIYDDNRISIEGDTHLAFTEDVTKRYQAYGWHVVEVPAATDGSVDLTLVDGAIKESLDVNDRPTLIRIKTVIAWPAPKARNTPESHGSALGKEEVSATKVLLGLDPNQDFFLPAEVLEHTRKAITRGGEIETIWEKELLQWKSSNPEKAQLFDRLISKQLPNEWEKCIPHFEVGKEISTRAASGKVLNEISKVLPEFWGGSADLAGSNNTTISNGGSFLPENSKMEKASPYGRNIHFGIREHAMGAILNGIALHGLTKIFGGTFLVFSDYMRGSVRLASLMNLPVTFIWSHDSIGVGEDGPTHQPIEHIASLRLIPNLTVIRPADANEVSIAWREIVNRQKPTGLILSRQNLPVIDRERYTGAEGVAKGAYVIFEPETFPHLILIATGSEVNLALASAQQLNQEGIPTRVVSAPCLEWFKEMDASYQESVLPKNIKARVSIEAGVSTGWREYVGEAGSIVGIDQYGASGSADALFKKYGFTVENIVSISKQTLSNL